jgi:enoyl-CoA hydratase/carnithine racemase
VTLEVTVGGGVAWLRLNRPEQRNAISQAMRADLDQALADIDRDQDVRVVVLTGSGSAFCAGADLKESVEGSSGNALTSKPVTQSLDRVGKPVIVAVNGAAVGGGLELALAGDIRIASDTATFALPEVKIGSLPGSGGTQRLVRAVSPALAAKMILTGQTIDAATALEAGLVSDVVARADLDALAAGIAETVAANAPLSLGAAKIALRAALGAGSSGTELERALWRFLSGTADREEGRSAFRERRPPRFSGS